METTRMAAGQRDLLSLDREKNQLKVYNSLTKKNDVFNPKEGNTVRWYTCGPTVYDVAHLGHARCYITFDIIRRILSDYFGYKVHYVMNITDIDDKIIKRARSNFLYTSYISQYLDGVLSNESFFNEIKSALDRYEQKAKKLSANMTTDEEKAKFIFMTNALATSNEALNRILTLIDPKEVEPNLDSLKDIIADDYDERNGHAFDAANRMSLFKDWAMKYENEFKEDMKDLNILAPDCTPRVSEYIEQIGAFIQKLEALGFAYRLNGSVYFDTEKFDSDPKHKYAKLVREAYGQKTRLDSGEGELSAQDGKKSPNDFALWKKSKPGEPVWKISNLEPGRPGWHIECSAMATHLLGETLDIHSGGCDLKFPHHDNELAQSEAYFNSGNNWVNYFLHSGHLSIAGCKMSKSLKNFITIRQALEKHTARQLRFAFLCHKWSGELDYSANTMHEAIKQEKKFKEFFLNVAYNLWDQNATIQENLDENLLKRTPSDQKLFIRFKEVSNQIDNAICDNFDTSSVLKVLNSFLKEVYKCDKTEVTLLKEISEYVEMILNVFGVSFFEDLKSDKYRANFASIKELAKFRAEVRAIAKDKDLLKLCDNLRERALVNLGIQIEDKDGAEPPFKIRFVDSETVAEEKALEDMEKKLKEEKARTDKQKLQQQREEKMKINPREMFLAQTEKYSKFDDIGMPTHDADGNEITKSAIKKLQRLYKEQKDKYERYLAGKE